MSCGGQNLTTCDVSASLKAVICQMNAKEMIRPLDDGLEICTRCGGRIRQLYAKNQNDVPYGWWPENRHEWRKESVTQVQVWRHLYHDVVCEPW